MFNKKEGCTFGDYIAKIRIAEAIKLKATTNMKMYEIAEKVGYPNAEHFSKVFKKVTGKSPNNFFV